jgi:two-component system, cell cycle sensor histidine kinase and response regulator CckA
MSQPLRILLIEDMESDAELILRALRGGGFELEHLRVDTPQAMTAALADRPWDLVISDFTMPQFSGLDALALLQESGLDTPFILVTGALGEEEAVHCLHQGAADYVLKQSLHRLPSAVRTALAVADKRRRLQQAEAELQANEQRHRAILDSALDAIVTIDATGKIVEFNPAAERMFGYSRDEAVGQIMADLIIPPTLREQQRAGLDRYLSGGEPAVLGRQIEKTALRRDGAEFPVEVFIQPILLGGKPLFTGFIRDITERKLAEGKLLESERFLHSLTEASPHWTYVFDFDEMGVTYRNRSILRSLNYPPDVETGEIQLETFETFMADGELPHLARLLNEWRDLADGQLREDEYRLRHADGSIHTFAGREVVFTRRPDGTVRQILGTLADITTQKRAEERFRDLFEHSPDAIFVESQAGIVLDVNPAACQLHGLMHWQLVGRHVLDLVPAAERESVALDFSKLAAGDLTKVEGLSWTADGRAVPVEITSKKIVFSGLPAVLLHVRDITQRKRAEQALQSVLAGTVTQLGHDFFRSLVEHLARSLHVKSAFVGELTGPEQNRIRALSVWTDGGYAEPFEYDLAGTPCEQVVVSQELRLYPDSIQVHFPDNAMLQQMGAESYQGIPLWDKQHRPLGVLVVLHDQPMPDSDVNRSILSVFGARAGVELERVHAEEAVQTSQRMLQLVLNNIPQGVFWKDRDSRFIGCNATVARYRGVASAEAIVGVTDREFPSLTPEQAESFIRKDQEIIASGQPEFGIIEQTTHCDGTLRWLETNKIPLPDSAGNVIGILGTWQDITVRKQHEEEIARLVAFPEMNPNPVLELTADGTIHYENAAARTLARELGFAHPAEMLPPGTADIVRECLTTLKSRVRLDVPCGKRIISWSFYPIPGHGVVHCYAGDVTEQRLVAEQLRQSQKLESVGQLAAGIAHDFNNLLTVIQGYCDLLGLNVADRPQAVEAVQEIVAASGRAASLTRQLLVFSRKQVAQRSVIDLNELTGNLTKMLGRILGEDITLRLECQPRLPAVFADPGMIEQVITNLAVNARDAMPDGGRLEIATSVANLDAARVISNPEAQPGRFACLTVRDNGSGIEPEVLSKIFEPFFTTKEVGKGTGLGLATVYGIVMQHQGVLEVASQPGAGTCFHVFLPASTAAGVAEPEAAMPAPAAGGSETILLVEDEAAMRPLMEMLLNMAGYTVLTASSGAAAMRMWPEHRDNVDLLLTDLLMPEGISGKQLAESLILEKPALRVIYMSGYSPDIGDGAPGVEEGFNYLQKPFTRDTLLRAVRRQLDARG